MAIQQRITNEAYRILRKDTNRKFLRETHTGNTQTTFYRAYGVVIKKVFNHALNTRKYYICTEVAK